MYWRERVEFCSRCCKRLAMDLKKDYWFEVLAAGWGVEVVFLCWSVDDG